jgi:hypothetical protein
MMRSYLRATAVLVVLFAITLLGSAQVRAQVSGNDVEERRAELQRELDELEREIVGQQVLLDDKARERASLERDIAILDASIKKAQLDIRARTISITQLSDDIYDKELTIGGLNSKLDREKESLAQLIRRTNVIDDLSMVELVLSNRDFSEIFEELDTYNTLRVALQGSFITIETTKTFTEEQKIVLEGKKEEESAHRTILQLQKNKIEDQEDQKEHILRVTKGEEKAYQLIIDEKQKSAAEIRTELFTLRGSDAIPFEEALDHANEASRLTGIRPALVLGVIAEESNLGANVGTGNWLSDMHPTRDRPVFADITKRLGLDPNRMPVSKKPWYGWGGAMGPAQFIPSTWVLYEDRVAKITGQSPANPWDPRTAFIASALLLEDNGGSIGSYTAERLAALRYFAGWGNANKPAYAFYGDEVMALATKYQGLIDILEKS